MQGFNTNLLSLFNQPKTMDVLTVILLLVIVILIINNKTSLNQKFEELELRIAQLQNLLRQQQQNKVVERPPDILPKPTFVKPPTEIKTHDVPKSEEAKPELPKPEPVIERHKEVIEDRLANIRRPVKVWEPPVKVNEEPELSFFERYPDLEKFIGENLVNKIGIAILVLAIGFFVKYAIDNNWIGPVGRVGIGILCGGI